MQGQDLDFRTSSRCSEGCGGACVEVARRSDGGWSARDTAGNVVNYNAQEWADFVHGVKNNEFDA